MNVKITPSELSGNITAPVSKSEAHRVLICAALADSPVKVYFNSSNLNFSNLNDDIKSTIECLEALGAEFEFKNNIIVVTPIDKNKINKRPVLNCHESGSTLRFMLPVATALCDNVVFTGTGRLPERPINDLLDVMAEHGVTFSNDKLPFETHGILKSDIFYITGGVSSQYITGLLLAVPLLDLKSKIILTSPLKSADYVNITLNVLKKFGIEIIFNKNIYEILNLKLKSPETIKIGGDWSGAAFFLSAGALNKSKYITVSGLDIHSAQGDKKILEYLEQFGAEVSVNRDEVTVSAKKLNVKKDIKIDIDATPDLLPILAVLAAFSDGKTEFYNGARLRLKESDRIKSTVEMINSLGFTGLKAEELPEGLIINGGKVPAGKVERYSVNGFNDHRIVMAASIAAANCANDVTITDCEAVNKSYPDFFNDFKNLGGLVTVSQKL